MGIMLLDRNKRPGEPAFHAQPRMRPFFHNEWIQSESAGDADWHWKDTRGEKRFRRQMANPARKGSG